MKTQQLIPNPTAQYLPSQGGSSKSHHTSWLLLKNFHWKFFFGPTARYFRGTVLAILLIQTTTTFAQNVTIPDANFKAALVGDVSINTNLDAEIQTSEAAAYTGTIYVPSLSIADLTGIEAFTNLNNLNCSSNALMSLDVSTNTALTYLDCSNNLLTSLNVSTNTALNDLICHDNQLPSLNVSTNTALTILECYGNSLTSLNVSTNTALIALYCGDNPLTSLNVSTNTALIFLECSNNLLTSLDVSTNTALTSLNCSANSLTSLNVSTNTALTYLECGSNPLTSLNVSTNTALIDFHCYANQLTSLNVSTNTALTRLVCYDNSLTSLDVSANTALITLWCGSNPLTSLNVSTNTALIDLACYINQLTSLNVSTNTALIFLQCSANSLTSLNVSTNTALIDFRCSFNQLTSLDVSTNTALTHLVCSDNSLTSLDVSADTALIYLYCENNQLICLNVQNGNNVDAIYYNALNNPNLICIQVDNVAYSNTNWTNFFDPTASFSIDCGIPVAAFTSNAPVCFGSPVIFSNGSTLANSWLWNFGDGNTSTLQNPSHTYPSSGNFMVTLTASSCYSSNSNTDSATITVNPAGLVPTISIAAVPAGAICVGTNVTFTASLTNGGGAPVYQWQVSGANVGINSPSYSSSILTNGQAVTCILTSNATCASPTTVSSNSIVMVVNSCLGIEANNINSITVYPNPNDGAFNIVVSTSHTNPYSLSIYNTLGQVIYQKNNIPTTELSGYPIDISTIEAGIYMLVVNINNIPHSIKVVKK